MMRRLDPVLAVFAVLLSSCGAPARIPVPDLGEGDIFAVITLDESGAVVGATGLQPFMQNTTVYSSSGRTIALGWPAEAVTDLGAPEAGVLAADRLRAAEGCRPRLPTPELSVDLATAEAVPVDTLPDLTADWLEGACPAVEPEDITVDVTCKKFSCPRFVTRRGPCRFELELDCDVGPVDATVWPDGSLCLEPDANLDCEREEPEPPRAASYACAAPEPCRIDAYLEGELPAQVDTVVLRDVEPYAPTPDLIGQLVLPPAASRFFGYAHDLAVSEGRVAVSLDPSGAHTSCAAQRITRSTLEIFDANTLAKTASATVTGCLPRLAPDADGGFLALRDTLTAFELVRLAPDGQQLAAEPADPRSIPGPGEPPLLYTADARSTYFDVVGGHVVAAVVTATPPGTKVFTWRADTLAPSTRSFLEGATIVAGASIDARTVALAATARSGYYSFDLEAGRPGPKVALPADLERDDNVTSDVVWSQRAQRALLTLPRKNASVLGMDGTGVRSRAVIFDGEARPMAVLPWADSPLALVAGAWSTDQVSWPASLHIYDLDTHRFRPGKRVVGHGAPGRMVEDPRGRIWVLLPWDAKLLRVTPR